MGFQIVHGFTLTSFAAAMQSFTVSRRFDTAHHINISEERDPLGGQHDQWRSSALADERHFHEEYANSACVPLTRAGLPRPTRLNGNDSPGAKPFCRSFDRSRDALRVSLAERREMRSETYAVRIILYMCSAAR